MVVWLSSLSARSLILQPGHGRAHLGIGLINGYLAIVLLFQVGDDLAGSGHDRVRFLGAGVPGVLLPHPSQAVQDRLYVLLTQPVPGQQCVLGLDVLIVEHEDAVCRLSIPPGPARLLQVVLQGPGNAVVHHCPDVVLVDTRAEGIGCADHFEIA